MTSAVWEAGFVRGVPTVHRATRGILRPDAGALAVLAPMARDVGLRIRARPKVQGIFAKALRAGKQQGALGGRILHGTGRIPPGSPMVVLAAVARSRQNAILAVETMMNALKGVADRWDESKA